MPSEIGYLNIKNGFLDAGSIYHGGRRDPHVALFIWGIKQSTSTAYTWKILQVICVINVVLGYETRASGLFQ